MVNLRGFLFNFEIFDLRKKKYAQGFEFMVSFGVRMNQMQESFSLISILSQWIEVLLTKIKSNQMHLKKTKQYYRHIF